MIMPFKLLLAKRLWHGEKATSHTGLLWPVNVHTHAAEPSGSTRQSLIRLSLLHVAASEASELKAIEVAGNVWPVWMAVHARIVTKKNHTAGRWRTYKLRVVESQGRAAQQTCGC